MTETDGGACRDRYLPIKDYAVIGDCHTAALVSRDGSIDWYCPARFDAPAVFCRLLDARRGGFLRVAPTGRYQVERSYVGDTNVLQTSFRAAHGRVRVVDFMPIHRRQESRHGYDVGTSHRVIRLVEGLHDEVEVDVTFRPAFDYARASTETEIAAGRGAVARAESAFLTLACAGLDLARTDDGNLSGRLRVAAGERHWVVLTSGEDPDHAREALALGDQSVQLERTLEYWQRWSEQGTYSGPYRAEVKRSALVLKLLTYEPTGAVVAAPTTSLPESVGGARNWDYRYTWLRDSSLMLYALMTVGHEEEAGDFFEWLSRATGQDPTRAPQIMYGIDGRRRLPESEVAGLEGYVCSRPVRIGNAAASQHQLDIYGEVLRAASVYYHGITRGDEGRGPPPRVWKLLRRFVGQAARHWMEPDEGIWEVRGGPRQFVYSKLMCWAALDRGISLARACGLEAPLDRWCEIRDEIRDTLLERGYSTSLAAFTQALDGRDLDASVLAIPRIGFLPATDPRVQSTIDAIRAHLSRDGFVYRYRTEDGLPGGEATFAMVSFWMVDALALSGRLDEGHALFDKLVAEANDLGLLSEEIDAGSGALLGNFPQGFSHMTLITSAVNLAKTAKHGAEAHSHTEAERAGPARRAASENHGAGRRRRSST